MKIKKIVSFLLLMFILILVGCKKEGNNLVLRVYNWQDYIEDGKDDEGNKVSNSVIEDWILDYKERTGKDVSVVYDTFETPEIMLNNIKTGKTTYDLACPSEYMIQKMIREGMVEKYDYDGKLINVSNFNEYGSPYIQRIFLESNLSEYAVPYMWGTMGLIYNPQLVDEEDIDSWSIMWNEKYKNMASAKDSVRDTYVVGVMYLNKDKLLKIKLDYESGLLTDAEYNREISLIMNDTSDIAGVERVLKKMKKNIFGFEVDNGKNDIVTGKIAINVAWSGDAVYSMDVAEEEEEVYLNYSVPKEGSNIWFDGWIMPKGANKELAQDFVNFLCQPEIAARNMDYIGYTTSIAGDEVFDLVKEWYAVSEEEEGEYADLTYFFGDTISPESKIDGKALVKVDVRGRQFDAQFPSEEVINRCAVMEDFKEMNDDVLAMWENVKLGDFSIWLSLGVVAGIIVIIGGIYYIKFLRESRKKKKKLNW